MCQALLSIEGIVESKTDTVLHSLEGFYLLRKEGRPLIKATNNNKQNAQHVR